MTVFAVAWATVLRSLRDRTALFFMVLLPVAIIVVLGVTIRGFDEFRVGLVPAPRPGPLSQELVTDLDAARGLRLRTYADEGDARTALRRAELDAVVLVPASLDADVGAGRPVTVTVLVEPSGSAGQSAVSTVSAVVADHAARLQAARFATEQAGGTFDGNLSLARGAAADAVPVAVRTRTVDGQSDYLPLGYSYSTPTMLVLFVFINALGGGAAIVRTRGTGVYARALAAPVPARVLVLGETVAYLLLALVQSAVIVGIGAVAFGVDWGDPLAALVLVLVWAAVGAGAGVLAGALSRTPEQVHAVGPTAGIVLGMLGGCMWPLTLVPDWLSTAGHAVPHAWVVDAWTTLLSRDGDLRAILPDLAVLAAFATALLTLAAMALRRRLMSAPGR
ncbi:ABC transporter permease [Streptomyces niveiscabiei]|uniref:ABC transporter permease n=1 Tax=Streptomyces niveiscabiei TaxID=164115 RepID=UPI0029AA45F5|nr:ABC transporter permease [Streptomyces niveiscabiei]MDX3387216.1 ABC transporter permease [Streptomyces niveiscabiei]